MTFHPRTHLSLRPAARPLSTPSRAATRPKLEAVRDHLRRHAADLVTALGHVAGAPGRDAGNRLIDELSTAPALLSRHVARLDLLRGLLLLEHLDTFESPFPVTPAALAPGRRMVQDCCRLAEGLEDLLRRIGTDRGQRAPAPGGPATVPRNSSGDLDPTPVQRPAPSPKTASAPRRQSV